MIGAFIMECIAINWVGGIWRCFLGEIPVYLGFEVLS
jgi:hypothetical protein